MASPPSLYRNTAAQFGFKEINQKSDALHLIPERLDLNLAGALAARMKGRAQAMLRAIAQQEACHAKKLAAVYFLNTGKKACPGRPERPCVTCINETLRQQYTAEHAAHEAYAALAENAGTHRCMLLRMAQEECEHAQLILCILQNCL